MSNQFQLLQQKRFRPLFFTQFLGAFNDNVFKTALITLVAFHTLSLTTMDSGKLTTLLPGLFILPFFIFSATAGQIADKFEKSTIIRYVKLTEIFIMLFASFGFFLHNIWLLAIALFMMGIQSSVFGPVKYAYLPQHLNKDELVGGNGVLEMGSFLAILLGQILGAWLASQQTNEGLISVTIVSLAILGYWTSQDVPSSPAGAPTLKINWNLITETFNNLKFIWQHQSLWLAIVAISWFWFIGATLLAQFPSFSKNVLNGNEGVFILLLSVFSLGIGIGSLLCEKLSNHKVELGLVIFGALGLIIFGADLYFSSIQFKQTVANIQSKNTYLDFFIHFSSIRVLGDVLLIGLFGGFYIVPLYAFIQSNTEKSHASRVIAGNNIMNALFMVMSAAVSLWVFSLGFNIPELFLITAMLTSLMTIYLCIRQPEYLTSFFAWIKKQN